MPRTEWKKANPEKAAESQRRYRERTGAGTAANRYGRWTEEQDQRVLAHSIPDRDLAKEFGRSVNAIGVRRSKLKKINSNTTT